MVLYPKIQIFLMIIMYLYGIYLKLKCITKLMNKYV